MMPHCVHLYVVLTFRDQEIKISMAILLCIVFVIDFFSYLFCYHYPSPFCNYRLVSGPAAIAVPNLGDYDGPFDSSICDNLTQLGLHSLARERQEAIASGLTPSLIQAIPAHSLNALRLAFAELHMLDDYSMVMGYFNHESPQSYPDPFKVRQALLLLPGDALLEHEYSMAMTFNSLNYNIFHGIPIAPN